MIRTAWFLLVAAVATLIGGSIIFVSSVAGHRGRVYDRVARRWSSTLLWASGCSLNVHGLEKVDWSRPQVLVCNHTGAFEILALAVTIPVRYHFVAKKELERVPVFGPAWKMAGHVSIDRSDRDRAIESLRGAAALLREQGGVVVIFPEGTRSREGRLGPFKKGAFMLAIEAGAPILPSVVVGSSRVTPPGKISVTAGPLDLYFDHAVPTDAYTPETVEALMHEVHDRMGRMLQEYSTDAEEIPSGGMLSAPRGLR